LVPATDAFFRPSGFSNILLMMAALFGPSSALAVEIPDTTYVEAANVSDDLSLSALLDLKISPFDVATRFDKGYLALNSVSGSRFDSPIRDLPFAIQGFTESFINDQNPRDIFDIARYSPGVTYRSNDFNEGNANLAIRGFAVSAGTGSIQMLRDGFHGPSIFDFTNISRVEVVKGPASFLYGQVAPGGIVNIITKSPKSKFESNGDLRYGSYNEYHGGTDVTGPAVKTLFYRLAASYDHDMNYWNPYDAYSWNVSPSLLWQPTDYLSLSARYEHFSKTETPQVMQKPGRSRQSGLVPTASDPNLQGVDVPGLPNDWNSMSDADFRNSETDGVNAWVDLKAGDHWDLRTAYSLQSYEIDMLFSGNLGMANNTTLLQGRRLRGQTYTNLGSVYEAVATGKYQFGRISLRLLFGAQYIDRSFDGWAGQAPNDSLLGSTPTKSPLPLWDLSNPSTWNRTVAIPRSALTESPNDYDIAYTDKSIYGGSTIGFFDDRLLVLAGLRLTETENTRTDRVKKTVDPITASKSTGLSTSSRPVFPRMPAMPSPSSPARKSSPVSTELSRPPSPPMAVATILV
jgi:iron complex outermembrane receptor protein